jgi:hypothetical protein
MEFDTEFIQFTSLEPSIYRLKETLNLLKIGLWLRTIWMEVSLVQTVFCDRLLETVQFWRPSERYSLFRPDGGPSIRFYWLSRCLSCRIFFLAFQQHQFHLNLILEKRVMIKKHWDVCRNLPGNLKSVRTVAVSWFVSEHEIQLRVEIGEAWPSVRMVLPFSLNVFNTKVSRQCRASGRLQRPVRTTA